MAWTDSITWTTGQIVSSTKLNNMADNSEYVRDANQATVLVNAGEISHAADGQQLVVEVNDVVLDTFTTLGEKSRTNYAIDGLVNGTIYTIQLTLGIYAPIRTYTFRFMKLADMNYITYYLDFESDSEVNGITFIAHRDAI
jgi:hypothetical protein